MTQSREDPGITTLLLDIEGTTTPISFVYDVLFPFARDNVRAFLERNISSPEVLAIVQELSDEHNRDVQEGRQAPELKDRASAGYLDSLASYVGWLIEADRKTPPLKSLQGRIWQDGYERGELKGEVFDDVPRAFERWRTQGKEILIYSSGSVLAQELLFSYSTAGDLTRFINGYFDTRVGPKSERESYRRITEEVNRHPSQILFISDVTRELAGAAAAGMGTSLSIRPGNKPQPDADLYPQINSLDEVIP
jgi:enolase-phosphatase E1